MKYLPLFSCFTKRNVYLCIVVEHLTFLLFYHLLLDFTVYMKMLLQGIIFLMLCCIVKSCAPSKPSEEPINETKKERVYEKQDNAFFETNIQLEPLIFTAGKVWLEHIGT